MIAAAACVAGLGLLAAGSAANATAPSRRFAVMIANNRGDADEPQLRYAEDDAREALIALREVGGLEPQDALLLQRVTASEVERALEGFEARLAREAKPNDQLLVYYSGHADEGELHLAGTRLSITKLTELLARAPVAVTILVVDSCRSGAATRLKGFQPIPGTQVRIEVADVTGRVVISSSGADESAQESESLRGSFFTHHLLAGIRGAADASRDGEVSLQEAYSYAYGRTVETTFATRGGVQHPTFHVDLKGRGDLVLSRPARARARLILDTQPAGEWLVATSDGRVAVRRYEKGPGPAVLALSPGEYRLETSRDGMTLATRATVPADGEVKVTDANLTARPEQSSLTKGAPSSVWSVAGAATLGVAAVSGVTPLLGAELRVQRAAPVWRPVLNALELTLAWRQGTAYGAVPFNHWEWSARLGVGHRLELGAWTLQGFAGALGLLIRQAGGLPDGALWSLTGGAYLALEVKLRLAGPLSLFLGGSARAVLLRGPTGLRLAPLADAALGVAIDWR